MIFSNTSNYMLKYQKAKAKLVEYDIPRKDYPKFPLNSNELSYPVVYILSRYAESVIENNVADMEEFSPHLVAASQYFDAAVGANDREEYDVDFLLSGAAAYFLSDDFGSAKALRLVVCTSTLAQGVNIPIKYLFMTSFMVARNSMRIRSFQNLMGRTARSGMYTEGSVIVTDPQLFDNKNNRKNGGNYKWNECIKMFDDSAAEPCGSSILSLVQDIRIDYETRVIGAKVAQHIIDHYNEPDCFEQYVNKLTTALHKAYPQKNASSIVESVMARKSIVEAIENHLCFVFSIDENADKQSIAADICKETLAYFMANDDEKALLEEIFNIITLKTNKIDYSQIKNYARTMIGIDSLLQIEKWIAENHLTRQNYTNEQLVEMIISFFQETHTLKKGTKCFADICQMWLDGCSFVEMYESTSLPIADLEDICNKSISYELSFFVGSIIDIIEISDEDIVNPLPNLLRLQRRLKYGVKTETAVSICEKIFNDRFLANLLADEIGHDTIETNSIVGVIQSHKDDILDILSAYPTYFSECVQWVCKD